MEVNNQTNGISSSKNEKPTIVSDYQTFLKMMTVQIQYQDPLNPMDPSDFSAQLATFSGVEQQVLANKTLAAISSQLGMMGLTQLASWIGQEARAPADVQYRGVPITILPNVHNSADRSILAVRDESGRLVSREDIPLDSGAYPWSGVAATGDQLPDGRYTLTLESWRGEDLLSEGPVEYYARVTEARGTPAGSYIILDGNIEVPIEEVTGLRAPQSN